MQYKDFLRLVKETSEEVGGNGIDTIASHQLSPVITVQTEDDNEYELVNVEVSRLFGCGCADGIVLMIRKKV